MNPRRSNTQRPSAWTRRRFLGVGGGALAGLVAGCSAASDLDASAGPTATPGASPTAPSSTEPSPTDMVAPSPAVTAPGVPLVDPARRVLVDTNVLLSALIFPRGVSASAFWRVVTEERRVLAELHERLGRVRFVW